MGFGPGTRIGPYELSDLLGVGGIGRVYRATDTNLKRTVAIKVLPEAVAMDAGRLARFQREAQVLASLDHPNIARIYGFERTGDTSALVMELVEGPTLADRIATGTPRVYVQPYPSLKGRWMVSPGGGIAPRWSRDGTRLFFMTGTRMMEVFVRTTPSFEVSAPRVLFQGNYSPNYDVTSDGSRFLMIRPVRRDPIRHLTVVTNSFE